MTLNKLLWYSTTKEEDNKIKYFLHPTKLMIFLLYIKVIFSISFLKELFLQKTHNADWTIRARPY